jgi:CheY-like chemotaxis protein
MNRLVTLALLNTVLPGVDVAEDGLEAVRLASLHRYDLILMDVQMPGLNGLDATRQIRGLPGGAGIAIVALTANAFDDDRSACLAAGMDGFLAKPFQPATLFELLETRLNLTRSGGRGQAG